MSKECTMCFRKAVVRDGLCQDCIDWEDYWNSLSPRQQRVELARMAEYTDTEKAAQRL